MFNESFPTKGESNYTKPLKYIDNANEIYSILKEVIFLIIIQFFKKLFQDHSLNLNLISSSYRDVFNQIMLSNDCEIFINQNFNSLFTCEEIAMGSFLEVVIGILFFF